MIGILCIFRKYPYPPQRRLLKILKGRGVSKTKILKEIMKPNWNFWRSGRVLTKKNLP